MSLLTLLSRAGAGGATLTVAPSTGHVLLTGKQATVSQTSSSSLLITPGAGHILLAGKLPTVTFGRSVAPGTGHSVLAGKQPSITLTRIVAPSAGRAILAGKQPSITRTTVIAPATGHVLYSGKQPTLGLSRIIAPASGHVLLSGKTPAVSQTKNLIILPGTGRLTFSGHTPVVQYTRWPAPSDVLAGVQYGPTGYDFTGTAIATGGPSIFASRMAVTTTTEKLTLTQKSKRTASQPEESLVQKQSSKSKNAYVRTSIPKYQVLTSPDEIWVRTNKETI